MVHILSSAHVHTTFCDGKTTAQDMAQTAYEMGFVSLGFTSHAPQMFDSAHCIAPSREGDYSGVDTFPEINRYRLDGKLILGL